MIYEFVLPNNKGLRPHQYVRFAKRWAKRDIAITQVCHAMRADSLPLFYRSNTFAMFLGSGGSKTAAAWFDSIDPSAINNLRKLLLLTHGCGCEEIQKRTLDSQKAIENIKRKGDGIFRYFSYGECGDSGKDWETCKYCGRDKLSNEEEHFMKYMVSVDLVKRTDLAHTERLKSIVDAVALVNRED
jgi:hypothetical protein